MTIPLTSASDRPAALLRGPWPVVALLISYFALGLSASTRKSVTGDEGLHLIGGIGYWVANDYRINHESGNWIQRWAALPVWIGCCKTGNLEHVLNDDPAETLFDPANHLDQLLFSGRLMIGLLGVALGIVVYAWSRRLFGPLGGLISLTLYAFSPTMLTHGFLITADLGVTFFILTAVGSIWLLAHKVSIGTLLLSCFTLSGLVMSKISGATALPMLAVLLAVRLFNPDPLIVALPRPRQVNGALRKLAVLMLAALVIACGVWLLIWASYGFRYSMYNPSLMQGVEQPVSFQQKGILNDLGRIADEHHLLPQAYLNGLSFMIGRSQANSAFFNGEYSTQGWLGFFPYCVAVKTPVEFFLVLLFAGAAAWRFAGRATEPAPFGLRGRTPAGLLYDLAPLLVLLAVYWVLALASHLNIGHRHVLPTYPPMFILAGAAAWWFRPVVDARSSTANVRGANHASVIFGKASKPIVVARAAVIAALVLTVAEALWFWPHYLAYFNLLIGGPHNGYKHLVDSSLDWSQDVKELQRWLDAHPTDVPPAKAVYISQFGDTWKNYGLKVIALPSFLSGWKSHVPEPLQGGTYCLSATELSNVVFDPYCGRWNKKYESDYQYFKQGYEFYRRSLSDPELRAKAASMASEKDWDQLLNYYDRARFARLCSYLRHREPDGEVGYSILIYRLTDAELAKALDGPPAELLDAPETLK